MPLRRRTPIEFSLLATLVAVGLAGWGFIEIADEVMEGDTHLVDLSILRAIRSPESPAWLIEVARDATALGSPLVLTLFTVIAALFLLVVGKSQMAGFVVIAVSAGTAIMSGLKFAFDRPRPSEIPQDLLISTASFPSGHAMVSAIVYLTLGGLISNVVDGGQKAYVLGVAAFFTGLVGLSRIYLAVHWSTDALAGWAAGAAWAMMCWLAARTLISSRD